MMSTVTIILTMIRRATLSAWQLCLLLGQMSVQSMRGVRYFVAKLNWFLYFVSVVTIQLCSVRLAPGRPRPKPWDTRASACKRLEIALSCTENPLDKVCLCILKIVNDNLRCGSQLRGLGSSHTIALSHCQGCEVRTYAIVIVVAQLDHIMTVIIVGSFFGGSSIITLHAWLKTMCFDFIIIKMITFCSERYQTSLVIGQPKQSFRCYKVLIGSNIRQSVCFQTEVDG